MRLVLAASLVVLAGCSTHKAASHSHGAAAPEAVVLASDAKAGGCHGKKVEMASAEGKMCHKAKTAELADAHGKKGCAKKAEMASAEGKMCHKAKTAELASADTHATCDACPKKADGTCDHEAGAQAGRECCKAELAKAEAN